MLSTRRMFLSSATAMAALPFLSIAAQGRDLPETTDIAVIRADIAARLSFTAASQRQDIMNPSHTASNLIRALDIASRIQSIIITGLYSDSPVDGDLGPYGRHPYSGPGWRADFVPAADPGLANALEVRGLISNLVAQNYYVAKVGVPASFTHDRSLQRLALRAGVALFANTGTRPHLSISSAHESTLMNLLKNR
jgi:hypothetical protein